MNTKDYRAAWVNCPDTRPMYVMTRDVTRGGKVYEKGTVLYGMDNARTFLVPNEGNIELPLAAVNFTGYGDAKEVLRATFNW